ncbi:ABC-type transport system permease component [Melioribacter roseus P3M-2]|uniref:Transport permease protein n=1 Tax=Melioribacter roseus (strain DSM 23840 / JCM 17771 / VKM B-2668 / P3M-2) TaxID=1191523 RepID=I6Z4V2_MELRP|nr:ABC transporter permease [Melioribacter roseus]AFN74180.1 ABC-type transport system permease component [Melioribacter roseus P3M-2]
MFNRIKAIAIKETRQLLRDVRMMGVIFLFPVFLLVVFGYAINFDVKHIQLAALDKDNSSESREFINSLLSTDYFDLVTHLKSDAEIKEYLDRKKAQCIAVIPPDFSKRINRNESAEIQFLIDGVDGNTATIIMNYVNAASAGYSNKLNYEFLSSRGIKLSSPITLEPRFWFNPDLNSTRFLIPGLIGMILIIIAVVTISLSIVREKERGTIEQLNVSSINIPELLTGKAIPYIVIAFINAGVILAAGYLFFGIAVKGSYFWLLISTLFFLSASIGIGILVSVIADSLQVAFQVGTLISLLPSMLLSGFVFPIESMPYVIRVFSNVTPTKFYIVCLRSILLKGAGIEVFWEQLLYMAVFTVIVVIAASKIYYKKQLKELNG